MMTALAGIQFFLCIFFVKNYSLKREDDQAHKEASKAWLKERKIAKKRTEETDQVAKMA